MGHIIHVNVVATNKNYSFLYMGAWRHRWELPGNYPVFSVVMVIYHYVERILRVLVTPIILYNIYDHA